MCACGVAQVTKHEPPARFNFATTIPLHSHKKRLVSVLAREAMYKEILNAPGSMTALDCVVAPSNLSKHGPVVTISQSRNCNRFEMRICYFTWRKLAFMPRCSRIRFGWFRASRCGWAPGANKSCGPHGLHGCHGRPARSIPRGRAEDQQRRCGCSRVPKTRASDRQDITLISSLDLYDLCSTSTQPS